MIAYWVEETEIILNSFGISCSQVDSWPYSQATYTCTCSSRGVHAPEGGGATPYNGLYRDAPPERGTFLRLQVYKRVGISQAEVYKRVEKSVI